MKKTLITLFITFSFLFSFAQNGITFKVEELSQPKSLLRQKNSQMVVDLLVSKTSRISIPDIEKEDLLLANSEIPDSLVFFDTHPFFNGMHEAFIHHRPFVLSPDMIWLLICQGFSQHVNANAEELKDQIVDFDGKLSLVVSGDEKDIKEINWENAIPQFTQQIKKNTKGNLAETIMADFSTTTPTELIATEVTLMESVQNYFEYVYIMVGCGIPEITLLGTPDDWQKVYDKAVSLRQYQLDWWIDELKPILKQFIKSSKGNIDTDFWKAMFRTHSQEGYGAPDLIDGWIVKFFPYDAGGKRMNLKNIPDNAIKELPNELAISDVSVVNLTTGEETNVELCAGFIGLEQNNSDFTLTPKIGWFVKRKTSNNEKDCLMIAKQKNSEGIDIRIKEVPIELNKYNYYPSLTLRFIGDVHMPEWMATKKINRLKIYGNISTSERKKILSWYKQSDIHINRARYLRNNASLGIQLGLIDNLDNDSSLNVTVWLNNECKGSSIFSIFAPFL
ncbi:MAG: DUF4419 domain-containing protein [Bacteroidales bacterium]|nr:DUF4419 domain-containing protein [Bacteroidales bacterium]